MPIYEYRCEACGHEMEVLQKISDDPLLACPSCRQDSLKKKVSAAAFRLKGSGWYETDFKSNKRKNLADGNADEKSAKATEGSKSESSDSKGDSKSKDSASAGSAAKSESSVKNTSNKSEK